MDVFATHGNWNYPDGESFYAKHGDYFGQEWESNYKDPTHSRTFPEGTTKVTCGSVVTDPSRSSSYAAHSVWMNSVDNGGLGDYYDIPVSSLNGTATFDVTVIFDDVTQATQSVTVQHVQGSAIPGCEPNCFNPSNAQVNLGGTVIWENIDSAPHTTTSGTPTNGPDGIIDSGLMMPDQSFSHTFDDLGVYDYFCIVHPWMQGKITVIGGN